jgi:hypothetical protein
MMQVAKRVPFDDPDVLNMVRALYIGSNVVVFSIYLYIQSQINKKKGTFTSHTPTLEDNALFRCVLCSAHVGVMPDLRGLLIILTRLFQSDMTTLKYVEPAPMGSSEEGKLVTTTVHAYDLEQLRTAFRSAFMGIAMMGFMHLYMKYTNPLLIQSIIPVKGAFENNLAKIHLWGQPAVGDLKRPFKAAQSFMNPMGTTQSDKKAIEAAERAGRGGVKEE